MVNVTFHPIFFSQSGGEIFINFCPMKLALDNNNKRTNRLAF